MFPHVVCVNLNRRPDRWDRFERELPAGLPFARPRRYEAVDSRFAKPPSWFAQVCPHPGAWGCLRTHLRIWEDALTRGWDSILVFEDDAIFCQPFGQRFREFMTAVPNDWDQIYLGGQHLWHDDELDNRYHHGSPPPQAVDSRQLVVRCQRVGRTHAYAMRPAMMQAAIEHCATPTPGIPSVEAYHVDHRLGEIHGRYHVYAPWRFLVGQSNGSSDVKGTRKVYQEHWWNEFPIREPEPTPVEEAVA